MSSTDLVDVVEVVAARLEAQLQGARVVYRRAVPEPHEDAYVVVRSSVGETLTGNQAFLSDQRTPTVWVTSVCRDSDPDTAAREAEWGSICATDAVMDWRPTLGRGFSSTARPEHVFTQPTQRDDSLPDVVFYASQQFLIPYQP